jgi:hypothetical protein
MIIYHHQNIYKCASPVDWLNMISSKLILLLCKNFGKVICNQNNI